MATSTWDLGKRSTCPRQIFFFLFYLAAGGLSSDIMESLLWHVRLCTALQYVWDLSSLTRDQTRVPWRWILN